jgi:integrase
MRKSRRLEPPVAENKLTDKRLRSLKPRETEQLIGDGGGLWVRVLPCIKGGAVNFYYRFQISGKERRFNCGTYPETSLASARANRNAARLLVEQGLDPILKEAADRAAATSAQVLALAEKTVDDLFDDWKRVYLVAHRSDKGKFVEDVYDYDVKAMLGGMKAKDVRLPHVVQVIDKILARGARRKANMVLSTMRQMFRHGLGRGIVETDPTLGLSRKQAGGKETPVDRNLSVDEIKQLKKCLAASGLHAKMQAGLWLTLATGVRVGELLRARWSDVDLETNQWTIPAENSKNSRAHIVHLSAFARAQIDVLLSIRSGQFMFAGRDVKTHLSDKALSKAVRDRIRPVPLKRRTPKTGTLLLTGGEWSPHDLRRTMASRMGDLGVAPHVIERCLNHVQQGIVGVYQRQEYMPERKAAFEIWGAKLEALTGSAP